MGLEQAVKIMDDVLLASCFLRDAYLMGTMLLTNACKKRWIFSRKKFRVGTSVHYCGLSLQASPQGKVIILPAIARWTPSTPVPLPTQRRRPRPVLAKWVPGLSPALDHVKQLTGMGRFSLGDQGEPPCNAWN